MWLVSRKDQMSQGAVNVLPFEQALTVVQMQARSLPRRLAAENVPLEKAWGRVLAKPVQADRDHPGFDRATRDGYALRAGDLLAGGPGLKIVGQVRAGERWQGTLGPGTALQIMTGAPMPMGADAVIMVEHVTVQGDLLHPGEGRSLRTGDNFVPRGSEARAGAELLPAGTVVLAAETALAAACGYAELLVLRKPGVAIVATGDELVEVSEPPGPEQIRNSNTYGIGALVEAAGGLAARLPIARDTRDSIRERIATGRRYDLLVLSGGVSMGEYDLVEEVLAEYKAEFFFTGVTMQPGKPVVFGRLPARGEEPACFFFGLPGNPISTQVTFHCFVEPFLRTLAGEPWSGPRWALARLREPAEGKPGLTRLLPARMDGTEVRVLGWQGSGDLAANARANCYAEILEDRAPGDVIRVLQREGR